MYLAISRQADREDSEVAEAYKKIAYEEADMQLSLRVTFESCLCRYQKSLELRLMRNMAHVRVKRILRKSKAVKL
jgi:rubrerythrin